MTNSIQFSTRGRASCGFFVFGFLLSLRATVALGTAALARLAPTSPVVGVDDDACPVAAANTASNAAFADAAAAAAAAPPSAVPPPAALAVPESPRNLQWGICDHLRVHTKSLRVRVR